MLIENAVVFTQGKLTRDVRVRTQAGRVTALGDLAPDPGERIVDAQGLYLLPGFVDIHIHGFGGQDTMQGEAAVRHMADGLAAQGVAGFLPTTMSASPADTRAALAGIAAVMAAPQPGGARVLGAHMEAPFLCPRHAGAQVPAYFEQPSLAAYEAMTRGAEAVPRLITLAPELPGSEELVRALAARGVRVAAGHSDATAEHLHAAADWGLTQVTHLFNAQSPLHHRMPGVPGAALTDARVGVQVIADLIHLHPDTVRLAIAAKRCAACGYGVLLITDAMMAAGMPDGDYSLGGQRVTVRAGAARLQDGTLAGSTLLMHQALTNVIRLGTPPEEAIPMVTEAPARSIGAQDVVGRIAPGCDAMFALMDGDWRFTNALVG
ncbi:MAG: N-acetylglucosamine-6-phosphate deacetylase [Oscillospiraceae bacterium]|jgi:N-acetylglucosamine-6-phosphate deacetylase|nr:N-acetylglucosamine-6-phosphate deacetylase [Oscillospiraceae bacterium]